MTKIVKKKPAAKVARKPWQDLDAVPKLKRVRGLPPEGTPKYLDDFHMHLMSTIKHYETRLDRLRALIQEVEEHGKEADARIQALGDGCYAAFAGVEAMPYGWGEKTAAEEAIERTVEWIMDQPFDIDVAQAHQLHDEVFWKVRQERRDKLKRMGAND